MAKHNLYTKIFRQLRGYLISPKLKLWVDLRKRLFNTDFPDNISQLKDYSKDPPAGLFNNILETHERMLSDSKFSELKNLEQRPPETAFENIQAIIKKGSNKPPAIVLSMPFYKKMIAAAALLIVLACSFFLLSNNEARQIDQSFVLDNNAPLLADTLLKIDSIQESNSPNKLLVSGTAEQQKYKRYSFNYNANNYLSFTTASINGKEILFQNNDLLYSFTKYPYRYGQKNPWNAKEGTVVKLNSYTNINVSPYLSSVIGDLYKVKRNGRATWKAKRAKAKITRWRKNDVKRFDKKKTLNPLDIIDLGENVY